MPLYEFHCQACDKTFEKLLKEQGETCICPDCGQEALKTVSAIASGKCAAPSSSGFG